MNAVERIKKPKGRAAAAAGALLTSGFPAIYHLARKGGIPIMRRR